MKKVYIAQEKKNYFITFAKKSLIWVLLFVFVGGVTGFGIASFNRKEYSGGVRFVLEDGRSGGGLSSLIGMAAQFGLDFNTKGSSAVFSGDNILELLKSRMLVEKTLLKPVFFNGRNTTLAEEYLTLSELREVVESKYGIAFHYLPNSDRSKFTRQQDSVLKVMYEELVNGKMNVGKPDKKLSFINVELRFLDEQFVCVFTELLVKEVTDFYVETKTKLLATNIGKLDKKADSILSLLNTTTYRAAERSERTVNLNPSLRTPNVPSEIALRDKFVLQTLYGEVIKNLELAKISLNQETPLIQVIDRPMIPLKEHGRGRLKAAITYGFIFGLFSFVVLLYLSIIKHKRSLDLTTSAEI